MVSIPVQFDSITSKNIYQLAKINDQSFPITYSETFYNLVANTHTKFSRFAYISDVNVGSLTARKEMDGITAGIYYEFWSIDGNKNQKIGITYDNFLNE